MAVEYEYDVFISWTGRDKFLKNQVRNILEKNGLKTYDSARDCASRFRDGVDGYLHAIEKSKVFLPIITNNLLDNPLTGGSENSKFSEVRKEFDLAQDADANGDLNIQIVCLTDRVKDWRNRQSEIDYYFGTFAAGNGFSRIDTQAVQYSVDNENEDVDFSGGDVEAGETPSQVLPHTALQNIVDKVTLLVKRRNEGRPVATQHIHFNVAKKEIFGCENFVGRMDEIEQIAEAFSKDKVRAVILRGMGGIGKSELAKKFATLYDEKLITVAQFVALPNTFTNSENITEQLYEILNNIEYVPHVRDKIREAATQKDRLDIMLGAVRKLPKYALIIIDNLNFPYTAVLKRLLESTECNFLITTRVVTQDNEITLRQGSGLKATTCKLTKTLPEITTLPKKEALSLFKKESLRDDVSLQDFGGLYDIVGGHTICIYIFAKALRANKQKSVGDIVAEFSENRSTEKVRVSHNDNERDANVLMHLDALFTISRLSGTAQDILRGLSLLDNGMISKNTLREIYGLNDNNEINSLEENGWLQVVGEDMIFVHPVISKLAEWKLRPTAEKDGKILDYLIAEASKDTENLPIDIAFRLENTIYYALLALARGEGKLYRPLWDKYVEINSRHASYKEVEDKKQRLFMYVTNKEDCEVISSYTDMVLVRQNPARIDVLEKYLDQLNAASGNYKWVSQMLSVSIGRLLGLPEYNYNIAEIIKKSLNKAMEEENDAAVMQLAVFLLCVDKFKSIKKIISPYIKKRKKQGHGKDVLMLELICSSLEIFPDSAFNNPQELFDCLGALIRFSFNIANESDKKMLPLFADLQEHPLRTTLKHPFLSFKFYRMFKSIENMNFDSDDAQQQFLQPLQEMIIELEYSDELNIPKYMEYAYGLEKYFNDERVSLLDPMQMAKGVITLLISALPAEKLAVLLEYTKIPMHKQANNYTLRDISMLDGALMILSAVPSGDKKHLVDIYQMHKEKLRVLEGLYSEDDYRIMDEHEALAEAAAKIGTDEYIKIAQNEYKYIYDKLVQSGENSSMLLRAGRALLSADNGGIWRVQSLFNKAKAEQDLHDLTQKLLEVSTDTATKARVLSEYLIQLKNFNNFINFKDDLDWATKQIKDIISECSRYSTDGEISWVLNAINSLWNCGATCNQKSDRQYYREQSIECCSMLQYRLKRKGKKQKDKKIKKPKYSSTWINAQYLYLQSLAEDDNINAMRHSFQALKVVCKEGVFDCVSLKHVRELYLSQILECYRNYCKENKKTIDSDWVNIVFDKTNPHKNRIKDLYKKFIELCCEQSQIAIKNAKLVGKLEPLNRETALTYISNYCISHLEEAAERNDFAPFGISDKVYGKCNSAGKYIYMILESVYNKIKEEGSVYNKIKEECIKIKIKEGDIKIVKVKPQPPTNK